MSTTFFDVATNRVDASNNVASSNTRKMTLFGLRRLGVVFYDVLASYYMPFKRCIL